MCITSGKCCASKVLYEILNVLEKEKQESITTLKEFSKGLILIKK